MVPGTAVEVHGTSTIHSSIPVPATAAVCSTMVNALDKRSGIPGRVERMSSINKQQSTRASTAVQALK